MMNSYLGVNNFKKLINMANPVLTEKVFEKSRVTAGTGTMTIKGTASKSLVMILMILAGAMYTWKVAFQAINPASVQPWMWGGVIGGFVVAMIISFKPIWAQYLAPVYAVLEGLFLGGISALFSQAFAASAPGIVMNATLLTILTAVSMLLVYRTNIIKVNGKFARIMIIAVGAIALYYLVSIIVSLFGVNLTLLNDSGPLSIGISLVIIGVAAFSLLLDYEFIARASEAGAPKYMEWYGAFSLMVTLIWLYLEILRILAKFAIGRE